MVVTLFDEKGLEIRDGFAKQVLLVEHDTDLLDAYALLLSQHGFAVTQATSVTMATALLEMATYDIIITTDIFPDGQGETIIFQAYHQLPHPLTVLMSERHDIAQLAFNSQADVGYYKGWPIDELIARIK